jgi:SAM-dependent methyltransferase
MRDTEGPETLDHYERLAASYDRNWSHSEAFLDWMTDRIIGAASVAETDRIADVGCGTGLFARRILDRVHPADPITCVDPSAGMLGRLPDDPGFRPVCASAEQLAAGTVGRDTIPAGSLDVLIMKEAVHHIPQPDRATVLAGLAGLLAPGGRLLVVMLPTTLEYPLFDAALRRFEELQPDPSDIEAHLGAAGLSTRLSYEGFELDIPKGRYLSMVRERYMSLLSTFDDDEIEAGIGEIDREHPQEMLRFADRFAFVLGVRAEEDL